MNIIRKWLGKSHLPAWREVQPDGWLSPPTRQRPQKSLTIGFATKLQKQNNNPYHLTISFMLYYTHDSLQSQ